MIWWLLTGMTLITFANRYAFLAQTVRYRPSQQIKRFLSYSSYAVLTAIWTPIVFNYHPSQGFSHAGIDYLVATALAALLSFMQVKSIIVVLTSIGAFFLIRYYI